LSVLADLRVVRGADPLHVSLRGQATDELHIFALLAHALREVLHDLPAVGGVVEGLDVDVGVLDTGGLVGDHLDALGPRLAENVLKRLRRVRHHGDGGGVLGDQILDDLDLLFRAGVVGAFLAGVDAGAFREVLVANGHPVEPGDALDFDDVDHRHVLGVLGGACRRSIATTAGASADRAAARDQRHGQPHRAQKGHSPVLHTSLPCEALLVCGPADSPTCVTVDVTQRTVKHSPARKYALMCQICA
jgi:hypothetical protein